MLYSAAPSFFQKQKREKRSLCVDDEMGGLMTGKDREELKEEEEKKSILCNVI